MPCLAKFLFLGICFGKKGVHATSLASAIVQDDGMFTGFYDAVHELGHLGKLLIIHSLLPYLNNRTYYYRYFVPMSNK